jgi:hypothetical protein
MVHPNDDNGDVLRRMNAKGDNLATPRNIDFAVVFPDQGSAEQFAEHFRKAGYIASVDFAQTVKELPWDVVVVKSMMPSHQGITDFESALQNIAEPLRGRNDGWGCLTMAEPSDSNGKA